MPPLLSVTVSVALSIPVVAYTWLAATLPVVPPGVTVSLTTPVEFVPSPQSIEAVNVSCVPGSVNVAPGRLNVVPSLALCRSIGVSVGGTL